MAVRDYQVIGDIRADGDELPCITRKLWLTLGLSFGTYLMLFSPMASSVLTLALQRSSAAEAISLVGSSSSFRLPADGFSKPGILKLMDSRMVQAGAAVSVGEDSVDTIKTLSDGVIRRTLPDGERIYTFPDWKSVSPIEKLAVGAIGLNEIDNTLKEIDEAAAVDIKEAQIAEVAFKDQVENELSNMDGTTKKQVAELHKEVQLKARKIVGVTPPLGFFDPLGFSTDVSEGKLLFYREVEVKHGRVAMLATLGIFVAEQFHPLFGGKIDVPSYIAFQQTPLQTFWPAVLAAIAIPEFWQIRAFNPPFGEDLNAGLWSIRSDRAPGDFGFDPFGLKPATPEEFEEMQTKEINNGRLAMIAASGIIAQELATGQKIV